jgi:integrase
MQFIKRKNGWSVRFYVNNDRKLLSGFKKQKEAEKAAMEYMSKNVYIKKDITVEDFFRLWFENYVDDLGENTIISYAGMINLHIIPGLGKILLSDLKGDTIQNFYTEKKKTLSSTRVQGIHKLLKMALNYAVMWEYLVRNPAINVKAPVREQVDIVILTDDELKKVLSHAKAYEAYIAILIAATTGMRMSEILALEVSHVDFERCRFQVTKSYNDVKKKLDKTKTKSSKRYVKMMKGTELEFKKYLYEKEQYEKMFGDLYYKNNFFCTYKDGKKLTRNYISKRFKKIIRKLNYDDRIDFKSLRHYHASYLLAKNKHPKIVQERLGHSSIRVTLDIYSHLIPSLQDGGLDDLECKLLE